MISPSFQKRHWLRLLLPVALIILGTSLIVLSRGSVAMADGGGAVIWRVSLTGAGQEANGRSGLASVSSDGRYVAFESGATNLVTDDTNGRSDVFVRDRETGETECISVGSGGEQGNDISWWPSISADGRYVAFISGASNLVPGDTNGRWDVFVHDRQTGQTTRVSVASDGRQGNDDSCYQTSPALSADGRYVAFDSNATNLVPGDTNGVQDIFVHDRAPTVYSISGRVPDGHSHPLPDAFVGLLRDEGSSYIMTTTTRLRGRYAFDDIPFAHLLRIALILRDG